MTGYSKKHGEYSKWGVNDFYGEEPFEKFLLLEDAESAEFHAGVADQFDQETEKGGEKKGKTEKGKNVAGKEQAEKEKDHCQNGNRFGGVISGFGRPAFALFPKFGESFFALR